MRHCILFASYGGGHAHMLPPVIAALRARGVAAGLDLDIKVMGFGPAKWILEGYGIGCLTYKNFLDPMGDADALAWGEELAREHHSPTAVPDRAESVAYLGLSFKDLVSKRGLDGAKRWLAEKGRQAFFPTSIMQRVLSALRPDFVVTTNSPRSEAALIETARQADIDTMIMTDLFTGRGDYILKARNITFLSDFAKDMFQRSALFDPALSSAHVTGNPAFDRLLNQGVAIDPGWLDRHFPAAHDRPSVLFADMPAYWHPGENRSYFRSEQEIRAELDRVHAAVLANGGFLLVRPHPSQDVDLYRQWLDGKHAATLALQPLDELLRAIALLVVRTSTVGLEAAILRRRVLQLDSEFHVDFPLAKMGVAWGADDFPDLTAAVGEALRADDRFTQIKAAIDQQLPNEPAATKVADIIIQGLKKPL